MNITQIHAAGLLTLMGQQSSFGLVRLGGGVLARGDSAELSVENRRRKQKGPAVSRALREFGCGGRI